MLRDDDRQKVAQERFVRARDVAAEQVEDPSVHAGCVLRNADAVFHDDFQNIGPDMTSGPIECG
jgi:hypothetical protein